MADSGDPPSSDPSRLRRALKKVRPVLDAMPDSALLPLNVDPVAAVAKVRGALPAILVLRDKIASDINSFDLAQLDNLETYALALVEAEVVYRSITARSRLLSELSPEASLLRAKLIGDAKALVRSGLIPAGRLSKLKGRKGHRNVATDLLTLNEVLRDSWPTIANSTPISFAEIDRAEVLGDEMVLAVGLREKVTLQAADAALLRHRAYSLFVRTYEQVRRAVSYLRWNEGDAARIAPSIHDHPKARRKKGKQDDPFATSPNREADVISEAAPLVDAQPGVPANGTSTEKVPVGRPGSDPFVN